MNQLRCEVSFPEWMLFLFRPFAVCGWWYEHLADLAACAIEDGDYDDAEYYIETMVKKHGESSETVRLSTRIERYKILGDEE